VALYQSYKIIVLLIFGSYSFAFAQDESREKKVYNNTLGLSFSLDYFDSNKYLHFDFVPYIGKPYKTSYQQFSLHYLRASNKRFRLGGIISYRAGEQNFSTFGEYIFFEGGARIFIGNRAIHRSVNYILGLFTRIELCQLNKIKIFSELGLAYESDYQDGYSNIKDGEDSFGYSLYQWTTTRSINLNTRLGVSYSLSDRWQLVLRSDILRARLGKIKDQKHQGYEESWTGGIQSTHYHKLRDYNIGASNVTLGLEFKF